MAIEISAPFKPYIGAGGVLTVSTGVPEQAIYWELVSWDPDTETEGVAYGSLKYSKTKTDAGGFSTNIYTGPTNPALVGLIDRVKVKCGEAFGVDFISISVSPSSTPSSSTSASPSASLSPSPSVSISKSASPSTPPVPNNAFVYHFDGTLEDTGDYGITLNLLTASLNPSPSPSPPILPLTFVDGVAKTNSAIHLDGLTALQTDPSVNIYPYVGNHSFLFELVINIEGDPDEYAWWKMPGQSSWPDDWYNLPSLILDSYQGYWYFYFSAIYTSIETDPDLTPIVNGNWYHVIAQYDASSSQEQAYGQIYVNGVLAVEDYTWLPSEEEFLQGDPDNRFNIGWDWIYLPDHPEWPYFQGKIDLCRMITNIQPWTAEQVAARYAAILAGA